MKAVLGALLYPSIGLCLHDSEVESCSKRRQNVVDNLRCFNGSLGFRNGHILYHGWPHPFIAGVCHHSCIGSSNSR